MTARRTVIADELLS